MDRDRATSGHHQREREVLRFSYGYLVFGGVCDESWFSSDRFCESYALEMPQCRAFRLPMHTGTNKVSQVKYFNYLKTRDTTDAAEPGSSHDA